ncbi:hypothetical protein EX30DRAFT_395339 [Ascodesmis nigricans]|uniref:Uncharacterized protein n=1 Tax=Ascodesmis nigricans TaxID=341454 RepID=A0A4S2MZ36_9PEZI|nr:hypothetical protein EX30DRAFT_395339 [Ascodesmis nigricans]
MALNMLTPDLLDLLIRFNAPFGQTADDFHHCILGEDEFTRIRELFFTVEVLAGCEDPMECLKQLRGGQRKHGLGAMDAQDLLAFMLNSEFILYAVHRDFDIAMNPNLANWVRMCQSTAETQGNGDASSTLLQRIQRIRVALVKGILGGQGEALGSLTPLNFVQKGMDFNIDLARFREALWKQGVYELEPLFSANTHSSTSSTTYNRPPTPNSHPPSSPHPPSSKDTTSMSQKITAAIIHGASVPLPPSLSNQIISFISSQRSLITLLSPDLLSTATIPGLVDYNPQLAQGLIFLILTNGTTTQRTEVISALPHVPITISGLELINDIVTKQRSLSADQARILIHTILEKGIRHVESLGASSTTPSSSPSALSASGVVDHTIPGTRIGSVAAQREEQTRHVKLLCLFIQSLLRSDTVEPLQLYYQIQDLGVQFMYVQEARELWIKHCANVGSEGEAARRHGGQ